MHRESIIMELTFEEAIKIDNSVEKLAFTERTAPPNLIENKKYYTPYNAVLLIETTRTRDGHVRLNVGGATGNSVYTNELNGNVNSKEEVTTFPLRKGQIFSIDFHWVEMNQYHWVPFI